MKMHLTSRTIAWALTLCLLVGMNTVGFATQTQPSDFEALNPMMDLVASAAISAGDEPEVLGNQETTLSNSYIATFFNNGLTADASLGITAEILTSPEQQAAYLSKVFAAGLPALEAIVQTQPINGYIGFQPVTVNGGTDNDIQLIGELYWGSKPMSQMSDADYKDIRWLDRAVYSLRADANAAYGYLITGFSVGSELDMEDAMQSYTDSILVEYINTTLGFSILYPSVFTDDQLVEDGDGVSASLADGSVNFFVKRAPNSEKANLTEYINVIANGITDSKTTLNEAFSSATVTYDTEEGFSVFNIYIVTDTYIYQAELSYRKDLATTYQMYTSYMENSFAVDEVSVG